MRCIAALWSPNTGVVNFSEVASSIAEDVLNLGGELLTDFHCTDIEFTKRSSSESVSPFKQVGQLAMPTDDDTPSFFLHDMNPRSGHGVMTQSVTCRAVITCAGVHSDHLARLTQSAAASGGITSTTKSTVPTSIPIRGRWVVLRDNFASQLRTNIYPVNDPDMPFLGVHLTPLLDPTAPPVLCPDGKMRSYRISIGPNSFLSSSRDDYNSNRITSSTIAMYTDPARLKFFAKYRSKLSDLPDSAFLDEATRMTGLQFDAEAIDSQRHFCGIRAQYLDTEGHFLDDLSIDTVESIKLMHVINCPSPAATSSLALGDLLARRASDHFDLALMDALSSKRGGCGRGHPHSQLWSSVPTLELRLHGMEEMSKLVEKDLQQPSEQKDIESRAAPQELPDPVLKVAATTVSTPVHLPSTSVPRQYRHLFNYKPEGDDGTGTGDVWKQECEIMADLREMELLQQSSEVIAKMDRLVSASDTALLLTASELEQQAKTLSSRPMIEASPNNSKIPRPSLAANSEAPKTLK